MKGPQRLWVLFILFGFLLTPLSPKYVEAASLKDRFENALMDIGRKQAASEVRATSRVAGRPVAPRVQVASVARSGFLEWLGELVSVAFSRVASFFAGTNKQVAIISDSAAGSVSSRATTAEAATTTLATTTSVTSPVSAPATATPKATSQAATVTQKTVQSGVTTTAFEALRAEVAALRSAGLTAETPLAREPVGQARYTNTEIDSKFSQLSSMLSSSAFDVQSANRSITANSNAIALTNKIDQLRGITIINPQIQGIVTLVAASDAQSRFDLSGNAAIGGTLTVANATTTLLDLNIERDLDVSGSSRFRDIVVQGSRFTAPLQASTTVLIGEGLTVYASSTLQDFTGVNATTTTLHSSSHITTLGNIGIGTTSPRSNLHVRASAPQFLLEDTTGSAGAKTFSILNSGGIVNIGPLDDTFALTSQHIVIGQSSGQLAVSGTSTPFAALSVNQDAGEVGFAVGSSTATNFIVDSLGRVGIGTTSPFRRFTVGGDGAFSGDLLVPNLVATGAVQASSTSLFGSGFLSYSSSTLQDFTGVNATTTNATTTNLTASNQVYFTGLSSAGGATDVNITADGQLFKVASSRQFKEEISTSSTLTLDKILQLNPVDFTWNEKSLTPGTRDFGLIAEDTYNILPELVGLDAGGNPISVSYSKLSVVALRAAQDILGVIDIRNAPTTTPTIVVNSDGVVAIGTTTSSTAHKLVVGGDIAATGFVNISTQAAKKDIDHLDSSEEDAILDKISTLGVATYHYTQESSSDPLRLGLIAEEAPQEVLSADGKGVDIYKLVSFALAGIKAQQTRIEGLAARVGESAAARFTSLFADEVTTRKLCLEDLCVTKEELRSLLSNSSGLTGSAEAATPPPSTPPPAEPQDAPPADTEPPVISLVGAAEIEIPKSSTWIDPGATVDDNVNSNLGIDVTGAAIDTSVLGEYIVRYNATDGAGNRAVEVVRTVRVVGDTAN